MSIPDHYILEKLALPGHDKCYYDRANLFRVIDWIVKHYRNSTETTDEVLERVTDPMGPFTANVAPIPNRRFGTLYLVDCGKIHVSYGWLRASCEGCGIQTEGRFPFDGPWICGVCQPAHDRHVVEAEIAAMNAALNEVLALIDKHTSSSSSLFMGADDDVKLHRIIAKALHFDRDAVPVLSNR